jgi:hypothetical protein
MRIAGASMTPRGIGAALFGDKDRGKSALNPKR